MRYPGGYFQSWIRSTVEAALSNSHAAALSNASIVAVHADDGSMAWYYQTTPGDRWDYDSTQKLVLADVELQGRLRQVVMQAAKNGFYYVLRSSIPLCSGAPTCLRGWHALTTYCPRLMPKPSMRISSTRPGN